MKSLQLILSEGNLATGLLETPLCFTGELCSVKENTYPVRISKTFQWSFFLILFWPTSRRRNQIRQHYFSQGVWFGEAFRSLYMARSIRDKGYHRIGPKGVHFCGYFFSWPLSRKKCISRNDSKKLLRGSTICSSWGALHNIWKSIAPFCCVWGSTQWGMLKGI